MRDTKQENDVGNDHGRDLVAPQLRFPSFFLFFPSFSFFFQLLKPSTPPSAWLFIGKNHFGEGEAHPGKLVA